MAKKGNESVEEQAVVEEKKKGETRKLEPDAEAPKPRAKRAETKVLPPDPELATEAVAPEAVGQEAVALKTVNPAARLGLTREEMNWAAVAHASILVTLLLGILTGGIGAILGVIIPAVIWYVYRDKSEYVTDQARQATIFQLAGFVAWLGLVFLGTILGVVGWTVSAVLVIVLIGLILLPVMLVLTRFWIVAIVALPIVQVVYGCYAALEAYNGRPFRYQWVADLVDRYQAET